MTVDFATVEKFEKTIARFFNAQYAVATDSCTHAIELSLRLLDLGHVTVKCPTKTYISVPATLEKLGLSWEFNDTNWSEYYYLEGTPVIDAAVYWKVNGYVPGSLMCLSFQQKKHLSLIRGGMILTDDPASAHVLKQMSYDGRNNLVPWKEQDIAVLGFHYYMPPETAALGLSQFAEAACTSAPTIDSSYYPDLSKLTVFQNVKCQ